MRININNLKLKAIIGTYDHERSEPQEIFVNVEFDFDSTAASRDDDLTKAVDYADMCKRIEQFVAESRFFLLEKLADEILSLVMADQRVRQAQVSIDKPAAIPNAESVRVTTDICCSSNPI